MAKPTTVEKIGMYKAESLVKHTRKNWDEWIELLNKAGARNLEYREIVAILAKKYKIKGWWQMVIAAGYEIHIGRRVEGRNSKGRWSVTSTKSLHHASKRVWDFLVSEEGQRTWLRPLDAVSIEPKTIFETEDGFFGEIRTMKKGERFRMSWSDPEWERRSFVQVYVQGRPNGTTMFAVMHSDLPDSRSRDQMRARWKEACTALDAGIRATSSGKARSRSR